MAARSVIVTATALSAAVIGGLLGGAPAGAVPQAPGDPSAAPGSSEGSAAPAVWPRPQQLRLRSGEIELGGQVALFAPARTDEHALELIRTTLRAAGAREIHELTPGAVPPAGSTLVVHVEKASSRGGGSATEAALRKLGAQPQDDLPSGGYRLAAGRLAGRDTIALSGVGTDGLFHAAQTLRQLVSEKIRALAIRDWPAAGVRGTAEAFYGAPWTQAQRLAHLDFMGRTKQNRFLYAPGNDPYRQAKWREPYPAEQRADFRALAERARSNHVTLGWAVAPGQRFCFSSQEDMRDLLRKADAMWALGVRAFQLQFQDISYTEWHCGADAGEFGSGPEAAARAQAKVANAFARHLGERHPSAEPLSLMPTEYYQSGATGFRKALATALGPRIEVAWTGVGVVPKTITGGELAEALAVFDHPLITQDNYPVNDFAADRLFLGPYEGREPAVATGSAALLANAAQQPLASRIPLFTAADYAWNPREYRPAESWPAAIDDLAGEDPKTRAALRALAGNSASSLLGAEESAYLQPLLDGFLRAYASGQNLASEAQRLRSAFRTMREAPERLAAVQGGQLAAEVEPWSERLARHGEAGEQAVQMLLAQARGDSEGAWKARLSLEELSAPDAGTTVGKGVLKPFFRQASDAFAVWTGVRPGSAYDAQGGPGAAAAADGKPQTVYAEADSSRTLTIATGERALEAVTVLTEPGTGVRARVEIRVPGKGWRRIGAVSDSGWTEVGAKGAKVDAVRLVPEQGSAPLVVHEIVPWSASDPAARLELPLTEADVAIGGSPVLVEAELAAQTPGQAEGNLTAKAPKGLKAKAPGKISVPRGSTARAQIEISAAKGTKPGTYEVPVRLSDGRGGTQDRTVTVRAFPLVGGPDLARSGRATASSEETADFPARDAIDGDPGSRWSSAPEQDDAWLQLKLRRQARVGKVVLNWQDAYAARYRIEVSKDGRSWRTAAVVKDGHAGRKAVRMDERGVRYIRIQGEERGTEYGYSLWSAEVYAVQG